MHRINQPGSQAPTAYANGLHIAAHLSMGSTPRSKRHSVWFVPAGGTGRGLAENDPRHQEAVKIATQEGPLGSARARWTDADGNQFTVREA